jgi:rfaE bifunctional protein nucleotidyltransferase chain/domain
MIVTRAQLTALVDADRAAGRTVAFANGCFDLLHVGHVRYLRAAAQEADRLIVAVNDDEMAARKGPGRPIMPASDRAALIDALRGVDYVIVFPEPTVTPLLELLRPDVHCKGTDYTPESVPERATVLAYGGRIAIVGDPKDHSTRDLIARISSRPSPARPSRRLPRRPHRLARRRQASRHSRSRDVDRRHHRHRHPDDRRLDRRGAASAAARV